MKVEQTRVGTVDVITPHGALLDQDAEQFARALAERLEQGNARVVICLKETPCMDSAALESLLDAADQFGDHASGLTLAGVTPTCREILEMTGLADRFRFFNDVNDAVKSFL